MNNALWLIWKSPNNKRRYKIGLIKKEKDKYYFNYFSEELKEAKIQGFDFYPGFNDLNQVYTNNKLFANIKTRLPNINRPDYLEILNSYNLNTNSSEMDILTATKGRLITDNYEFVPVFDKTNIEFDVAGTRHSKDLKKCKDLMKINENLYLELEPNNAQDENAIKVIYQNSKQSYHIGYVPRYYTKELSELLKEKVNYSAMIKNINFEADIFDEEITASVKIIFD